MPRNSKMAALARDGRAAITALNDTLDKLKALPHEGPGWAQELTVASTGAVEIELRAAIQTLEIMVAEIERRLGGQ